MKGWKMKEIDLVIEGDKAFQSGELKGIKIRETSDGITKVSSTRLEGMFLDNEWDKIERLKETGFSPTPFGLKHSEWSDGVFYGETYLYEENLGQSEPVTDETEFRRNCALLLYTLKKHGIRHGDISTKNIIVKNNKPMLIDFHQSKFAHEPGPDKRPEGDAYCLWEAALELSPDTSRHIRKWRAIRPHLKSGSIADVGCAEGDYLLMAFGERILFPIFVAIDSNFDALNKLSNLWFGTGFGLSLNHWDLGKMKPDSVQGRNILFMSVFAHIAQQYSISKSEGVLSKLCANSEQLFFETQLIGDGPGVHKDDDEVYKMLKQYGKVEKLVTIPVHGREPYARSVWRVT